jgi:hypothetical protein
MLSTPSSIQHTTQATQRKSRRPRHSTLQTRYQKGSPQSHFRNKDASATPGYAENAGNKRVWKIRTTLKCKRKKKSNGEPNKHKARATARGDTLRRAMIKAQVPLPASYNPTIMRLTFSLFLQVTVIQTLHMATMDIKSAYLNAALSPEADWIVTTQESHIANALYGLPDSGRLFYQHYKAALLAEEYKMSAFDNCLLYRTTATETTYIIVYVDDTFIFSNSAANIDAVIANVGLQL